MTGKKRFVEEKSFFLLAENKNGGQCQKISSEKVKFGREKRLESQKRRRISEPQRTQISFLSLGRKLIGFLPEFRFQWPFQGRLSSD